MSPTDRKRAERQRYRAAGLVYAGEHWVHPQDRATLVRIVAMLSERRKLSETISPENPR